MFSMVKWRIMRRACNKFYPFLQIVLILFFAELLYHIIVNDENVFETKMKLKWAENVRKWFVKRKIRQEESVLERISPQEILHYENLRNSDRSGGKLNDFDNNWPDEAYYAFLWYALGPDEICSALTAMATLKAMVVDVNGTNEGRIDYLLVFLHTHDGLNPNEERDQSEVVQNIEASERLLKKWEDLGGQSEEVILGENDSLNPIYLRNKVKYHLFALTGYTKFMVLDPFSIPTKNLAPTLLSEVPSEAVMALPLADKREEKMSSLRDGTRQVHCLGKKSPKVGTKFIILSPFKYVEDRIKLHLFNKMWTDLQAINYEFSCNDEIEILPQNFVLSAKTISKASHYDEKNNHLITFSSKFGPWEDDFWLKIYPKMPSKVKSIFDDWRDKSREICSIEETRQETEYQYVNDAM